MNIWLMIFSGVITFLIISFCAKRAEISQFKSRIADEDAEQEVKEATIIMYKKMMSIKYQLKFIIFICLFGALILGMIIANLIF